MSEAKEALTQMNDSDSDFEVGNFRVISSEDIDEIQKEELSSDPRVLGAFADWAIAEATDWPIELIQATQKAGGYEELGQAIIDKDLVGEMQNTYSKADWYGHHFSHYDHSENELTVNDTLYYIFRVN